MSPNDHTTRKYRGAVAELFILALIRDSLVHLKTLGAEIAVDDVITFLNLGTYAISARMIRNRLIVTQRKQQDGTYADVLSEEFRARYQHLARSYGIERRGVTSGDLLPSAISKRLIDFEHLANGVSARVNERIKRKEQLRADAERMLKEYRPGKTLDDLRRSTGLPHRRASSAYSFLINEGKIEGASSVQEQKRSARMQRLRNTLLLAKSNSSFAEICDSIGVSKETLLSYVDTLACATPIEIGIPDVDTARHHVYMGTPCLDEKTRSRLVGDAANFAEKPESRS